MSMLNYPVKGTVFGKGGDGTGPDTQGMSLSERTADTSVNRQIFTDNATPSGALAWQYSRKIDGIQLSVVDVRASGSLGPSEVVDENKYVFRSDI